ncbi:hypothetical protein [Chitinophaga nivalis]|uniref:T9SS C-terminal target domain-containing protein n=1 Tax=Chitinophaga nivalis TaxID=2991709 RepID=A0ABT3IIF7_9BACT|nr:hypothetical protein [Chitinophaga nivalis]MCW3466590.1 hypothetical protein [Chitinophaga nivalis]MCW3483719.1 hypothetical protein [Chitinophaga nivalis]
MKPFNQYIAMICMACMTGVFTTSCQKEKAVQQDRPVSATSITPAKMGVLSGVLGTGKTVRDTIRLTAGTYQLQGIVYVDTLDIIQIDPGTVLKGIPSTKPQEPGGTLVITRGAKIFAQGTATNPIIFTSNSPTPAIGDIGGLVILGRAFTNRGDKLIEGIATPTPASTWYGGTNGQDNSGILKYVRIEYAGFILSTDNELNGLSLGGVGSGTTIDYVEVYKPLDDGIEFFGGTVNANHLVVVNPSDDGLDFDEGYRGRIQFALIVEDSTSANRSISHGIESDNNFYNDLVPVTHPQIANLTIIGLPNRAAATRNNYPPSLTGRYGVAAQWRRNSQFEVYNAVVLGFENGWLLDNTIPAGASTAKVQEYYRDGISIIKNSLVHAYNAPFHSVNPLYPYTSIKPYPHIPDSNKVYPNALDPNAGIRLVNPFNRNIANFFLPGRGIGFPPTPPSPALSGGYIPGLPAGFIQTPFRGAFSGDPVNNWTNGWTIFNY